MMRRQLWWMVVFTVATAVGAVAAPEVIKIAAVSGLRYDLKRIYVKPNVEVKWVFENRDTMLHNLVITAPGARMEVVNAAIALANKGMERDYVPESPKVLWAFGVVPQGESQSLNFRTPANKGDYPYVCTYPGHGLIMHGVMTVTDTPKPPVKSQALVPELAQAPKTEHAGVRMRRAFMPDSGPASIAVTLPGEQSYCWDAGACRFRYAWPSC